MPSLFLTLTSDEVSSTKWPEITELEALLRKTHPTATWNDMPVECALLFHKRLQNFLRTHILGPKGGMLGRVQHHIIKYEVQGRDSLHAHIVLWLHLDDVDNITSEICAYILATYNNTTFQWDTPDNEPHTCTLAQLVCITKATPHL